MDPRYSRQRIQGETCITILIAGILVLVVAGCLGSLYATCMAAITHALP